MTFALPLSLGIDGVRESMDIRLVEEISKEDLIAKVNAGLPEDIRLFDVTEPVMKPGKIAYASFTITIEPEDRTAEECEQTIRDLLAQETVVVKKKSKSGIKDVDIKPFLDIKEMRVEDGKVVIEIMLPAGSTQNVNPHLLFDALENFCGTRFYAGIVRNDLFDKDGVVFE
jgi:radical SAM-linked protein